MILDGLSDLEEQPPVKTLQGERVHLYRGFSVHRSRDDLWTVWSDSGVVQVRGQESVAMALFCLPESRRAAFRPCVYEGSTLEGELQ